MSNLLEVPTGNESVFHIISEVFEQAESGRRRKYYRITPAGKKCLEVKRGDWEEFTVGVNGVLGASVHVVA
jgi:DNA-binding PadR family transcriptional regulator